MHEIVAVRTRIAVCMALAAVAGCSTSSATTGGRTPSLASSVARQIYLDTARPLLPPSETDDELISLGHALCAALNSGIDYVSLVANETSGGALSPDAVGKLIASAVVAYCPNDLRLLPGGADGP